MIEPPKDPNAQILQYVGIAASLLSITKGCAEWWARSSNYQLQAPISKTLQASLFFLPHVLFRTSAMAFIGAFLGYFSLIPIMLANTIVFCAFLCGERSKSTRATLVATIFVPFAFYSLENPNRKLMKRAITIFTTILLLSLTFVRLLPIMVDSDDLVSTYGLRHLNFGNPTGAFLFAYS